MTCWAAEEGLGWLGRPAKDPRINPHSLGATWIRRMVVEKSKFSVRSQRLGTSLLWSNPGKSGLPALSTKVIQYVIEDTHHAEEDATGISHRVLHGFRTGLMSAWFPARGPSACASSSEFAGKRFWWSKHPDPSTWNAASRKLAPVL